MVITKGSSAASRSALDQAAAVAPGARREADPTLAAELAHRVRQHAAVTVDTPGEEVEDDTAGGGLAGGLQREDDRLAVANRHGGSRPDGLRERHPTGALRAGQVETARAV